MDPADRDARPPIADVRNAGPVEFAAEVGRQEAMLRDGRLAVRVGQLRERVVGFGVGVPPEAPYLRRARSLGLPTVPRGTGGTGVLHLEGDVIWALVLPRTDPRVGRDYVRAYGRLGRGITAGLARLGVEARWAPAPALSDDYCPLSARGQVLVRGARILGAAAQHATDRALLHHGSVSWTVDRAEVDRLFDLPPGGPSARLGGVAELGVPGGAADLADALARALSEELER